MSKVIEPNYITKYGYMAKLMLIELYKIQPDTKADITSIPNGIKIGFYFLFEILYNQAVGNSNYHREQKAYDDLYKLYIANPDTSLNQKLFSEKIIRIKQFTDKLKSSCLIENQEISILSELIDLLEKIDTHSQNEHYREFANAEGL